MKRFFLTSTVVVLVAMLLSIALPVVPPSSYAQADVTAVAPAPAQVTSAETPQPASPAQLTVSGANPGVYFIDDGSDMNAPTYPVDGAIRFFGWSTLHSAENTYNWTELDSYLAKRQAQGLETGIMITTYDGLTSGDIRSTPNFVIKKANTVFAAQENGVDSYAKYWRKPATNSGFDYAYNKAISWTLSGNASIEAEPTGKYGNAAKLGGVVNGTASVAHSSERIPAMPSSLNGTKTVYVNFDLYIDTTDSNPNDHLYVELWSGGAQLGASQLDVNNLGHAPNTWSRVEDGAGYTFDVSSIAPEKNVQVVFRAVNDGAAPTTFWVDNVQLNVRHLIPNYESADYVAAYGNFIQALGDHSKDNAELEFVAIGTGLFGENQPVQSNFRSFMSGKGLTSEDWVTYMKNVTSKYVNAFTVGVKGTPRSLLTQAAPTYLNISERKQITDYAAGFGVGISLNFLSPDWTQSYRNDLAGFYDPTRTYWRGVPIAFESYEMDLCNPVTVLYALANGLDKHVDYLRVDPALLRLDNGQPDPTNIELYAWARQYVGKNAQTTPRVFTVMNEHRNPTLGNCRPGGIYYLGTGEGTPNSVWPHLGNFNFYLTQVDGIPGGQTVPETNDKGADSRYAKNPDNGVAWDKAGLGACPVGKSYRTDLYGANYPCNYQPYNQNLPALGGQGLANYTQYYNIDSWTGAGKEAYVVRRTDQNTDAAKNNPYMFFMIDNGYIDGKSPVSAKITVKYFDIGTDSWSLKYDAASGEKTAGTVTKTNSKQLKTVTFTVADGKFAGRLTGGSDFYLDSRNPSTNALDGNEWVHAVEVEKTGPGVEDPTPTPTATATETPTATPTATQTSVPTSGAVQGRVYNDANGNGSYQSGETLVAGSVMALTSADGAQELYTATTGADGKFRFEGVNPGQYLLKQKSVPLPYLRNQTYATGVSVAVTAGNTTNGPDIGVAEASAQLYLPTLLR